MEDLTGKQLGPYHIEGPLEGRAVRRFAPLAGPMSAVAWSPDGAYLAGGTTSGAIPIWDTATGDLVTQLSERSVATEGFISQRNVVGLFWLPDGAGLISSVDGPGTAYFLSLWTVPSR